MATRALAKTAVSGYSSYLSRTARHGQSASVIAGLGHVVDIAFEAGRRQNHAKPAQAAHHNVAAAYRDPGDTGDVSGRLRALATDADGVRLDSGGPRIADIDIIAAGGQIESR